MDMQISLREMLEKKRDSNIKAITEIREAIARLERHEDELDDELQTIAIALKGNQESIEPDESLKDLFKEEDRLFSEEKNMFKDEMRPFVESEKILNQLVDKLVEHNILGLYLEEHKKQRKHSSFGSCGKMKSMVNGYLNSGISWNLTAQGHEFWNRILP